MPALVVKGKDIDLSRPAVMGIVNATPDSFSDAGELPDTASRVARGLALFEQGAQIIDVGGQSGITGVPEVEPAEEIARVLPVVKGLRDARPEAVISVDTYKPAVVEAVLDAGAAIVNDVSGLLYPEVADLCAEAGAGLVIMHNRSRPKQRLTDPSLYDVEGERRRQNGLSAVTSDVVSFLRGRAAEAESRGLPREALIFDPGPDFSKTPRQTITVLQELDEVSALGRPLLLALSRKDFVGALTQRPPRERLAGTLAAIGHVAGTVHGCVLRVHDVDAVVDYLHVGGALAGALDVPDDLALAPHLRRSTPVADLS